MSRRRVTHPLEPHQIKSPVLRQWYREGRHRLIHYKRDMDVWVPHPELGRGYPPLFIDRPNKQIAFCGLFHHPLKLNHEFKVYATQNSQELHYPVVVTPRHGQYQAYLHASSGKVIIETEFGKASEETNLVNEIWRRERPEFKRLLCQLLHENNLVLIVDVCLPRYTRNSIDYTRVYQDDQLHIVGFVKLQPSDEQVVNCSRELTKIHGEKLKAEIEKDSINKPYYFKWVDEIKTIKTTKTLFRETKKWNDKWFEEHCPLGWTLLDSEGKRYYLESEMGGLLTKLRDIFEKVKTNPRSFAGCKALSETEETLFADWVLNQLTHIDKLEGKSMMEIYQKFLSRK